MQVSEVRFCQSYNIRVIKVPMFQRHLSQDLCLLGASTSQPQCRRFLAFQRLMTLDRNPASLRSVLHLRCGLRLSKADGQGVPAGLGLHKGVALVDIYIYIYTFSRFETKSLSFLACNLCIITSFLLRSFWRLPCICHPWRQECPCHGSYPLSELEDA